MQFDTSDEIVGLLAAIEGFRARIDRALPSQQISLLLTVARQPGITMSELVEVLRMPQGSVSRNVKSLAQFCVRSRWGQLKPAGYDLLTTRPSDENPKKLAVFLTQKGEEIIAEIDRLCREVHQEGAEKKPCTARRLGCHPGAAEYGQGT